MTARFARLVFFLLALLLPVTGFAADTGMVPPWPSSDVTFTVPSSQGSEEDAFFDLFREAFAAKTGKTLVPRYVPGQGGADAWARMVDDAADGSVLTTVTYPNIFLRALQPDSGVYPETAAVCHIVAYVPSMLWTAGLSAFDSVRDLADAARGMSGNFMVAGPGRYTAGQIAARAFDRLMGVKTTYIPYAGSVEAAKAVLNRQAAAFWGYAVKPDIPGAALKPLAVAAESRLPSMPEVPTFRELGIDLVEGVYLGVAVPAETSEYTRTDITEFFDSLAGDPAFQAKAAGQGVTVLNIGEKAVPGFLREQEEAVGAKMEEFEMTDQ